MVYALKMQNNDLLTILGAKHLGQMSKLCMNPKEELVTPTHQLYAQDSQPTISKDIFPKT